MNRSYQFFLGIMVFLLAFSMHSHALDNQKSFTNSTMGNLTGPVLTINKIPVHCVNETFNVTGTTSLSSGTRLRVSVYRGSYNPGIPPQRDPWYDRLQKEIPVVCGLQQENTWTYSLNTSGSYPDEYSITVEPYEGNDVYATAIFNLDCTCSPGDSFTGKTRNTHVPVHSSQVVTTVSPTQKSADIPFIIPSVALGTFGIVRLLTRRNEKN